MADQTKSAWIIGSRGSPLALAQANIVRDSLKAAHPNLNFEIKIIKTMGDIQLNAPLAGGLEKGLFTKEIEQALLSSQIDFAVHSLKDLPVDLAEGLKLGAVPEREDPRDVLISKIPGGLDALPPGSIVATSSIRRKVQLRNIRPDCVPEEVRGNVETRLKKLKENSNWSAMILAAAGLKRLGIYGSDHPWKFFHFQHLNSHDWIPAVGQAALGIEIRDCDPVAQSLISTLNHAATEKAVTAERSFLSALGGGCQIPLGAHATLSSGCLFLRAVVFDDQGKAVYLERSGDERNAPQLGTELAREAKKFL